MFGTVARLRVKPGMRDKLMAFASMEDGIKIPGHSHTIVYQMDADPNELIMVIVFESREAYVKNAESPEQHQRYLEFVELLEGPPEWNDGEVIYNRAE